jgi:hypothetical protein
MGGDGVEERREDASLWGVCEGYKGDASLGGVWLWRGAPHCKGPHALVTAARGVMLTGLLV